MGASYTATIENRREDIIIAFLCEFGHSGFHIVEIYEGYYIFKYYPGWTWKLFVMWG